MKSTTLSIEKILAVRSEAFATIRHHSAKIQSLANGVESLDLALQSSIAVRGIDAQGELLAAARNLAGLLNDRGDNV